MSTESTRKPRPRLYVDTSQEAAVLLSALDDLIEHYHDNPDEVEHVAIARHYIQQLHRFIPKLIKEET